MVETTTESESTEYTDARRCHHHPECAYFTSDRAKVIHKWTFLSVIGTLLLIAVFYFAYSNYIYKSSFKTIIDGHKTYVTNLENTHYVSLDELNVDSITTDSKIILDAIIKERQALTQIHKEESSSLDCLLEMHSQRMSDDFANLTLWASVLMIVFLVFSIYAMYKMDEMQNRGGESLSKIYDAYNRVMFEIKSIRQIQSELERNYSNQISSLNERSGAILSNLNADINSVTQAANNSIQSFNAETAKLQSNFDEKIQRSINNSTANIERTLLTQEECINKMAEQIKNLNSLQNLNNTVKAIQEAVSKLEAAQVSAQLNKVSTPSKTNSDQSNKTEDSVNDNISGAGVNDTTKKPEYIKDGDPISKDNSVSLD